MNINGLNSKKNILKKKMINILFQNKIKKFIKKKYIWK